MDVQNNLYGKEIDMLSIYGPMFFHGYGNNKESVEDYLKRKHVERCNCYIGKTYDKIDGLLYHEVKERHERLQKQIDSVNRLVGCGNECPGAEKCPPAGRRSRTEWCTHGNVIE